MRQHTALCENGFFFFFQTMVSDMWESSEWLGKSNEQSNGKRNTKNYFSRSLTEPVWLSAITFLTHYHKMPLFDTLKIYSCGKHKKTKNCL